MTAENYFFLRGEALLTPHRLDLAAIEAQMAWPHDQECRNRAMAASIIEHMKRHPRDMRPGDYEFWFSLAANATPLAAVIEEFADRTKRAFLVGMVLHDLVGCASCGIRVTKENLISRVIAPYEKRKDGGNIRISVKTFQNHVWPEFESVAHFWAAALKHLEKDGGVFPCQMSMLREFLADAEAYRVAGETLRMRQSPTTILNPSKTLKLPPWLTVKPSTLEFEPA